MILILKKLESQINNKIVFSLYPIYDSHKSTKGYYVVYMF